MHASIMGLFLMAVWGRHSLGAFFYIICLNVKNIDFFSSLKQGTACEREGKEKEPG